jgi:hypothetical protein
MALHFPKLLPPQLPAAQAALPRRLRGCRREAAPLRLPAQRRAERMRPMPRGGVAVWAAGVGVPDHQCAHGRRVLCAAATAVSAAPLLSSHWRARLAGAACAAPVLLLQLCSASIAAVSLQHRMLAQLSHAGACVCCSRDATTKRELACSRCPFHPCPSLALCDLLFEPRMTGPQAFLGQYN